MRKFIYILIVSCSSFFGAKAQDGYKVAADTSMEPMEALSVDSTLTANELTIPIDSVESWKNLSAFAYAKYLDSLLRAKQEKAKVKMTPPSKTRTSSSSSSTSTSPEIEEPQERTWLDRLFTSKATVVVLWILAGLFVSFILYRLFLGGGNPFKKNTKTAPQTVEETVEEEITSESDFDKMIRQAAEKGNYRLATRYQYLKALHRLAEKHFIEMAADKTNYQYVRELAGRGPAVNQQFQNDFASLTLNYEYVWYGEFNVDDVIYNRIARGFNEFNQKI